MVICLFKKDFIPVLPVNMAMLVSNTKTGAKKLERRSCYTI